MRVAFFQAKSWPGPCGDAYSQENCCYCGRPVRVDAARLCLTRTSDGEWWAVDPSYVPIPDEVQGGGVFTLPIGPDCLRRQKQLRFAVAPRQPPTT